MKDYYKSLHKNRKKPKLLLEYIDTKRLTKHMYHLIKANERKDKQNTKSE